MFWLPVKRWLNKDGTVSSSCSLLGKPQTVDDVICLLEGLHLRCWNDVIPSLGLLNETHLLFVVALTSTHPASNCSVNHTRTDEEECTVEKRTLSNVHAYDWDLMMLSNLLEIFRWLEVEAQIACNVRLPKMHATPARIQDSFALVYLSQPSRDLHKCSNTCV